MCNNNKHILVRLLWLQYKRDDDAVQRATTGFRTSVNFFLPCLCCTEPVEIVVIGFFIFFYSVGQKSFTKDTAAKRTMREY